MKTSEKIIAYLKLKKQVSINELVDYLEISRMGVSKQLSNLIAENKLVKIGRPPKVFYMIKEEKMPAGEIVLDKKTKNIIDKNYLIITPSGERKEGIAGFAYWCRENSLPLDKTAEEYKKTLEKYQAFRKSGLISGMHKFQTTFEKVGLDHIFYLDFYSIERFRKTKLGQLLLYAKQSQNKKLMRELADDIRLAVNGIIKKYHIDAIGFIPPTVKREVQFMKELEKNLHPSVKIITITKIKTDIIVPQKTLNKLKDRIENAKKTIVVNEPGKYKNILLIDDAVGSGATLNETSTQIKQKGIAEKVIGLSITGSFKGFDVISEV
ncbi:MAG: HTH domain-containing protein [Candidatus Moranbacteria bacterium]|nr:HTH domain-containing protein [Candidatus Moranbacteria bacterium]